MGGLVMPVQHVSEREAPELPFLEQDEEVRFKSRCDFEQGGEPMGPGLLFVTTARLTWLSTADGTKGYSWDYRMVILHAICRDVETYPRPCIYCQLDSTTDDEDAIVPELRFVPLEETDLDELFGAIAECTALHPDEEMSDSDVGSEVAAAMGWIP